MRAVKGKTAGHDRDERQSEEGNASTRTLPLLELPVAVGGDDPEDRCVRVTAALAEVDDRRACRPDVRRAHRRVMPRLARARERERRELPLHLVLHGLPAIAEEARDDLADVFVRDAAPCPDPC